MAAAAAALLVHLQVGGGPASADSRVSQESSVAEGVPRLTASRDYGRWLTAARPVEPHPSEVKCGDTGNPVDLLPYVAVLWSAPTTPSVELAQETLTAVANAFAAADEGERWELNLPISGLYSPIRGFLLFDEEGLPAFRVGIDMSGDEKGMHVHRVTLGFHPSVVLDHPDGFRYVRDTDLVDRLRSLAEELDDPASAGSAVDDEESYTNFFAEYEYHPRYSDKWLEDERALIRRLVASVERRAGASFTEGVFVDGRVLPPATLVTAEGVTVHDLERVSGTVLLAELPSTPLSPEHKELLQEMATHLKPYAPVQVRQDPDRENLGHYFRFEEETAALLLLSECETLQIALARTDQTVTALLVDYPDNSVAGSEVVVPFLRDYWTLQRDDVAPGLWERLMEVWNAPGDPTGQ